MARVAASTSRKAAGWRVSDRVMGVLKPGNAGGAKDPDFWCAFEDGGAVNFFAGHALSRRLSLTPQCTYCAGSHVFRGVRNPAAAHFPSGIMAVHGRATTSLAVRRQGLTLPQTRSDAARTTGRMAAPPWASPRCPAGAAFSSPTGVLGLDSGVDRVRCVVRQQASSAIGSRNENHDLLASMREPQSHRASPERGENELRRNWDFLSTS